MKALSLFLFSVIVAIQANAQQPLSIESKSAGRATTWDDAMTKCQALGEGWRLPNLEEYMLLAMTGQVPKFGPEGRGIYPMWVQGMTEEQNAEFKGSSIIVYLSDGKGYEIGKLDISPELMASLKEQYQVLKEGYDDFVQKFGKEAIDAQIKQGDALIAALDGGFEVRCIHLK